MILARRCHRIEAEQRERERLPGPIVEVGADAPERLFLERRVPAGRLANTLRQAHVLVEAALQLRLLPTDGVATTLHDPGQQDVREQANPGSQRPGANLCVPNFGVERIRQQIELVDGDDAAITLEADWSIDFDQPTELLALVHVFSL